MNIEKIIEVDSILLFDFVKSSFLRKAVVEVNSPVHSNIIKIQFSDLSFNQNTFDHSYYTKQKGWASYKPEWTKERYGLDAKQLTIGDTVFKYENGELKEVSITNIEENIGEVQTYNIITDSNHNNYFANGILVHNEKVDPTIVKPILEKSNKEEIQFNYQGGGTFNRLKLLLPSLLPFPKYSNLLVSTIGHYEADVISYSDYYPFGMQMPERNGGDYRFGFNGKEGDDEVKGNGNSLDFGARIYNPRIGRWSSIDPETDRMASVTPYRFGLNNPFRYKDSEGKFELDPQLKEKFPKAALFIENIDKVYNNQPLPAEFEKAFGDLDLTKIFNEELGPAIEKWSTLESKEVQGILVPESGSTVYFDDLDTEEKLVNGMVSQESWDENGNPTPVTINNASIIIDDDLLEVFEFSFGDENNELPGFEGKSRNKDDAQSAFEALISTLLHESVHIGRLVNKLDDETGVEPGKEFEKEAFGNDIKRKRKSDLTNFDGSKPDKSDEAKEE